MAKDTYYLKHDSNAAHDPKIESMLLRFGMAGYGRFWSLAELLREQSDGKMPRKKWGLSTLAKIWGCSEVDADEYLEALISTFELIRCDGEMIWSDRVCRDMEHVNKKREEARRSIGIRWENERIKRENERSAKVQKDDTSEIRTQSNSILGEHSIGEDSIGEQSSVVSAPPAAAASFSECLKKTLADNAILISHVDFDSCLTQLIVSSSDSPAFLDYAIPKALKAKQPGAWFVKGILEWDWIGKFKKDDKNGHSQLPPRELFHHTNTSEEDAKIELQIAHSRQKLDMPLSDRQRELLGLPPPESTPKQPVDDFPDDQEEPKK